jgi:LysR family transcriptional regulator of gallate degradation
MDQFPKFRQLRILAEVVRAERVTQAARNLHLSQPAVSRLIRSLELRLGVRLFERTQQGMVPNRYCQILVGGVDRALHHLHDAEQEIGASRVSRRRSSGQVLQEAADHELNAVVRVAQFRSVTRAARNLCITPTAVGRSLRQIEERLGIPLFERLSRLAVPTDSGRIVSGKIQLALAELRRAREDLGSFVAGENANLAIRIGALPLSRVHLVPLAIDRLIEEMPNVTITVVEDIYENLLAELGAGKTDLIVGTIRESLPVWMTAEKLFDEDMVVVAGRGHPLLSFAKVRFSDLQGAKWILPRKGAPLRRQFEGLFRQQNLPLPRRYVEANCLVVIRSLLLAGDWLAVLSRSQIYYEEMQGLCEPLALPIGKNGLSRPVGITLRKDDSPTRCVRRLIEHIRTVAKQFEARRGGPTPLKHLRRKQATASPHSLA